MRVHEGDYGVALRFALVPEAQGQGYGSELGRAALSFAFDVVGLERVIAITRADNLPAQRSLEKLGMTRERVFGGDSGKSLLLYAAISPRQVSRPA